MCKGKNFIDFPIGNIYIIIILFILYFKFKYDEYNILLKQLIQLCYNTCPVRY